MSGRPAFFFFFYLIKSLLFVVTAVPDASAVSPYKVSRPTPATYSAARTSTHRPPRRR